MKDPNDYNVRAVERAIQILNCFDNDNSQRGVSEIAQAVGLHKATTHRIVTTLLNYGYLERAEDEQRYRLGLQLASLGYKVPAYAAALADAQARGVETLCYDCTISPEAIRLNAALPFHIAPETGLRTG